jgi:hypothetical protein
VSVLTDVLAGARRGLPVGRLAAELGVDRGLVEAALDHWVRLGLVTGADDLTSCGSCGTAGAADRPPPSSPGCWGCPFHR